MPATTTTVTIPAEQSLSSNAVDLGGALSVALKMPHDWTPANISFEFAVDGETFGDLYESNGSEIILPVVAGSEFVVSVST